MSEPKMPEALTEILAEPGWWHSDDRELFRWEAMAWKGFPAIRVAWEHGEWWATFESDGSVILDVDYLLSMVACLVRVHRAIGTPLGHFTRSFEKLAEMTR